MLKRWSVRGALAVVALGLSTSAWAGEYGDVRPWKGRFTLGWTIPLNTTSDWLDDGFNFGGGFGYYPPDNPIAFRIDFFWSWHDFTNEAIQALLEHSDNIGYADTRVSFLQADLVLRTRRRGNVQLFGFGGVGAYNRYVEIGDIVGWVNDPWYPWWGYYPIYGSYFSDSDVEFGYGLGGGMEIHLAPGQGSFFIEASYRTTLHDPAPLEFVPLEFGYKW